MAPATKERAAKECETLTRQARSRGLKRGQMLWRPDGWLTYDRRCKEAIEGCLLAAHAEWAGPVKLVRLGEKTFQRIEVFLDPALAAENELVAALDESAADACDELLGTLVDGVFAGDTAPLVAGWQPPTAAVIADWLSAAGYTSAIDEQQNLRLSLRCRGCDGQVRIVRAAGRLRLTLDLGTWERLDPIAERAMLRLAAEANDRGRLARIAWHIEGDKRRCEAQVDLSGLPMANNANRAIDALWADMLRLAVGGLELAMRRLALELEVLADLRHAELAARIAAEAPNDAGPEPDERNE
jgi:hypothetical protein